MRDPGIGKDTMNGTASESWDIESVRDEGDLLQLQYAVSATHLPCTVAIAPHDRAAYRGRIQRQWIDDIALVVCETGPCSGRRSQSDIASTDADYLVITRGGGEKMELADGQLELNRGDAVAWDSRRAHQFVIEQQLDKLSLLLPRHTLDELGLRGRVTAGALPGSASPATKLLLTYLDALSYSLPTLSRAAVTSARNATLELGLATLSCSHGVADSTPVWPALRSAVEQFVGRHLDEPELNPVMIASATNISVRTLHRLFRSSGESVGEYIRRQRLARARQDLLVAGTSVTISAIAHRWGFADPSHFTRTFRQQYGYLPRECATNTDSARSVGLTAPEAKTVHRGASGRT
jgi:AraC family transcriptional activator of tynA and feaB